MGRMSVAAVVLLVPIAAEAAVLCTRGSGRGTVRAGPDAVGTGPGGSPVCCPVVHDVDGEQSV